MAKNGALPTQLIEQLIRVGHLTKTGGDFTDKQIQPASADLTLSDWGYCVKAAFLPNPDETVEEAIKRYALYSIDISKKQVLSPHTTYIFRTNEQLALDPEIFAYFSPKSSVGRLNLWVRTLSDRVSRFDRIPHGYHGPLYVLITPRSWPVMIQMGLTLNQIRFYTGNQAILSDLELKLLHKEQNLLMDPTGQPLVDPVVLDDGILLTLDLSSDPLAYRAKHSMEVLDLTQPPGTYDPLDFFDPIPSSKNQELIVREDEFYLLPTFEAFRTPLDYCVEMVAYDVTAGEFRSHYAGFIDPGFGYGEEGEVTGRQLTLEVIPHESVILRHRQPVCKMVFERLAGPTTKAYGSKEAGSHYHQQRGPGLSKYFKKRLLVTDDRLETNDRAEESKEIDRAAAPSLVDIALKHQEAPAADDQGVHTRW